MLHQTGRWAIAEDWYQSGTPGWFVDPAKVPGGAFIDEGIYWIDLFRWPGRQRRGRGGRADAQHRPSDIAVEDWGFALFTFANGVTATLEASWTINAPRKTGPSPKHNVWSGSRWSAHAVRCWTSRSDRRWGRARGGRRGLGVRTARPEAFGPPSPFPLNHLIDGVDRTRPPMASIRDAREAFVVAMAAYDSAKLGRAVTLI